MEGPTEHKRSREGTGKSQTPPVVAKMGWTSSPPLRQHEGESLTGRKLLHQILRLAKRV